MKRIMKTKRILATVLLIIMIAGSLGCMNIKSNKDILMEYISQKYEDDEFTFVSLTGGSLGSDEHSIVVSSKKYPDEYIIVRKTLVEGGGNPEIFSDNYMAVVFKEDVEDAINAAVNEVYSNYKVIYKPTQSPLSQNIGPDTNLNDYLSDTASRLMAVVFIDSEGQKENRDENLERFRRSLKDNGIIIGASLIFLDGDRVQSINEYNYDEYMWKDELSDMRCDFSLDGDYEFIYTEWR